MKRRKGKLRNCLSVLYSVKTTDSTINKYKVGDVNLCEDMRQQVSIEENMRNPEARTSINMKQ